MNAMRAASRSRVAMVSLLLASVSCIHDATSTEGVVSRFRLLQPPPALALPGYPLYHPIKVRLSDERGFPLVGHPLRWTAPAGNGRVTGGEVTDSVGEASAEWTLGPEEGIQVLQVHTLQDSVIELRVEARGFNPEKVSASYIAGCGIAEGNVWCWGRGLMRGAAPVSRYPSPGWWPGSIGDRPALYASGGNFIEVGLNGSMMCALSSEGGVTCFWYNRDAIRPTVMALPAMRSIVSNSTTTYMCGLAVADSTPWCWSPRGVELRPANLKPMLDLGGFIGFNPFDLCGRAPDSTAVCFERPRLMFTPVLGAPKLVQLVGQGDGACGLTATRDLWCSAAVLGGGGSGRAMSEHMLDDVTAVAGEGRIILAVRRGKLLRIQNYSSRGIETIGAMGPWDEILNGNTASCVRRAGRMLLCDEEHWGNGSFETRYHPVQPAVDD